MNDYPQQVNELAGKTIVSAAIVLAEEGFDDEALELFFSDGTTAIVTPLHGGYTGYSRDEYFCYVSIALANPNQNTDDDSMEEPSELY